MEFKTFVPSEILKPYVECFYQFESRQDLKFDDTVFPSGKLEIVFNLGQGTWESLDENGFVTNPAAELWGQITKPLSIRSKGKHSMFGVRFLEHSAAYFFEDAISSFNDRVFNLHDILGNPVRALHSRLLEAPEITTRIKLVENFLLNRMRATEKKALRIHKVAHILKGIKNNSVEHDMNKIALSHGITSRYLHKLIFQHTGLSPKSFDKIIRFQQSLS